MIGQLLSKLYLHHKSYYEVGGSVRIFNFTAYYILVDDFGVSDIENSKWYVVGSGLEFSHNILVMVNANERIEKILNEAPWRRMYLKSRR